MIEIFACGMGAGLTYLFLSEGRRKKRKDEQVVTEALNAFKLQYSDWCSVDGGYEYRYQDIRCRIERLPEVSRLKEMPKPFGFRLSVWKNNSYIVTGYHYGKNQSYFIYNDDIGTFKVKKIREEVESHLFYQQVKVRYKIWEQSKNKHDWSDNVNQDFRENILKKHRNFEFMHYLKQIQQLPTVMPKGRSFYTLKGFQGRTIYVEVLSEGKYWTYQLNYSHLIEEKTKTFIMETLDRKREGLPLLLPYFTERNRRPNPKEETSQQWNKWQRDFDAQLAQLKRQQKWLTGEEIHLAMETYPNDLDDLKELYERLGETAKEELVPQIEKTLTRMHENMAKMHDQIEGRKKQDVKTKLRVMETRSIE